MNRQEITENLIRLFSQEFEIENPGLDEDLRTAYEFDSIDAITLLQEIETMLQTRLTQHEKKMAMEIRTINQICDYIETIGRNRP